ncbi:MAG: endonuclease III [Ruminococcaceae bacterium]|nr:endonuclease III [Oscillospiraceae bacterium]
MDKRKQIIAEVVLRLKALYPDALCALEWGGGEENAWKLLVMGRLSAQCTDARVNIICRELFSKYPTAEALGNGDITEIENIVKPCGLYRMKASDIKRSCKLLCDEYGGVIPDDMDELLKFPGVGRKIANLLLGDLYKKPAIVADTHCIRICGRLGMYDESLKDPVKVEKIMSELVEPHEQSDFCHRIVQFGRDVCIARSPKCSGCPLADICKGCRNKSEGKTF